MSLFYEGDPPEPDFREKLLSWIGIIALAAGIVMGTLLTLESCGIAG